MVASDSADEDRPADMPEEPAAGEAPVPRVPPRRVSQTVGAAEPEQERATSLPQPGVLLAFLWAGFLVLSQLIVSITVGTMVAIGLGLITQRPEDAQGFINQLLLPVGTFTSFLVAVSVVFLMYGRKTLRYLGWRNGAWHQWILVLLIVVPLAVLASEVTNWMSELLPLIEPDWLRRFRDVGGEMFQQLNERSLLLVFVAGCLLPGLGEEIYCRGFISRGLIARYGLVLGTLTTSFLFGAMHLEPVQSSGAFCLGIGLQLVFLTTRSLAAPIAVHTLNNFLAFMAMRYADQFPIPGVTPMPDGAVVHTPWPLMLTAAISLGCLVILLVRCRTRWILPDGSPWWPGYVSAERPPASLGARAESALPSWWLLSICGISYIAMLAAVVQAHHSVVAG